MNRLLSSPSSVIGLLLLVTTLIYLPGLSGPFIYDDNTHIANNAKIHSPDSITNVIFNGKRHRRILLNLSYGLNGWISGQNPISYKLLNLGLHLLTVFFVWMFLRTTGAKWFITIMTTALFALHPLQVESVTYIFGRVSLFSGLFTFWSLYLLAKDKSYPLLKLISIYLLALLNKESAVLLLAIWPLYEALIKRRELQFLYSSKALITYSMAFLYIPLHLFFTGESQFWGISVGFDLYPYFDHVINQLHYYFYYLVLLVNPFSQSIYHPLRYLESQVYVTAFLGLIFIGGSLFYTWKIRGRYPFHAFLIIFFFLNLIITNGPLQMLNPFAEYRLYTSNFSAFYLVAVLISTVFDRFSVPLLAKRMISAGLVGAFSGLTLMWTMAWGNGYEVYQLSANHYSDYEKNQTFAGVGCELEGKLACAEKYYMTATELISKTSQPSAKSLFRLASVQMNLQKYELALQTLNKIPEEKLKFAPAQLYQTKLTLFVALNKSESFYQLLEKVENQYPNGTFSKQKQLASEHFKK